MESANQLKQLIDAQLLTPLFQPIIDTRSERVIGYEALIRGPSGHPLEFPDQLFSVAQANDLLSELEIACREAAIRSFLDFGTDSRLFLNVNPNVLQDNDHPHGTTLRLSQEYGLDPERIVIELSERYPIQQPELLKEAVQHYQSLGFAVAIDDLGAGYSGLKLWSEIKPDFVKIDRYFITNLQHDKTKREFVQSILSLAKNVNATVIAEGIEHLAELEQLQHMGLHLCQGYLLGRPKSHLLTQAGIAELAQYSRPQQQTHSERIAEVCKDTITVTADQRAQYVLELFANDKKLHSIPVIEGNTPIGMVRREMVMELFSGSYGRALYANKDVTRVMDKNPVIVDVQTPLEHVSSIITDNSDVDVFREIIVTHKQQYYGVASIRDLLRRITDARVQSARYANPLTLLPGNVPIHQKLDQLLQSNSPLAVAYFDLNNFKPYNDNYGYSQGDNVIQYVAQLLTQHIQITGAFIGHIGGDDFVAISTPGNDIEQLCQLVLDDFEQNLARFLSTNDRNKGYIEATGRDGRDARFALLGLAVGIIKVQSRRFYSHHDIAALASSAKKKAKQQRGNHYYVDYH